MRIAPWKIVPFLLVLVVASIPPSLAAPPGESGWTVGRSEPIGKAWAGHPVGFCFTLHDNVLYAAYYNEERFMVVGRRPLGAEKWTFLTTKERVAWDSHNYITLTFDREGHVHLAANMHAVPLRYYRTESPGDITTLKGIHRMTGKEETRCTYPKFIRGSGGQLLFMYRDGGSGNGRRLVNAYDEKTKSWTRFLSKPLFSGVTGGASMNAYPIGMTTDPKGMFHIAWVWRNSSDCSTNHDLSYVRSGDFRTWTTSSGEKLDLPITLKTGEVVAPVPVNGGLANFGGGLDFDLKGRVIITYIKFDEKGHSQIYAARLGVGGWKHFQLTKWEYRWHFKGGGCIPSEISWSRLSPTADGKALSFSYKHIKHGPGRLIQRFDPETLKPLGPAAPHKPWPDEITRVRSKFPGMQAQLRATPPVTHGGRTVRYLLRWETLPVNRDRARKKFPPFSPIEVFELVKK